MPRRDPPKRPAVERIADFLEIYGAYDETTAREQASRCVQCADPACVGGCPLASRIPEWLALTAEGQFREAAEVLQVSNCLPELSARVCPADKLCEATCLLDGRAEPVSIWAIEQFLHRYAFEHGATDTPAAPPNGRSIAVIGADAGGLACADDLGRLGYGVTVIDANPTAEGSLLHSIPLFRLERNLVQRRIETLRWRGVGFQTGVRVGRDVTLDELQARHAAVYLGFSARKARTLDVPGAGHKGIVQALPFILLKNTDLPPRIPPMDLTDRCVVVIGGGDTAIDCVRTAVRCGATQVTCVYRRDMESMPCSRREFENAIEEGGKFLFESAPVAVLGDETGAVTGLRLARTQLGPPDADGRRPFAVKPDTEFILDADLVLLALGYEIKPFAPDSPFHRLATDGSRRVLVNEHMMTSMPGVFAGGDLVRGPTTAIQAVRDGRLAAAGIHRHVMGGFLHRR